MNQELLKVQDEVSRYQSRYMRSLSARLPLNDIGLPTGFWQTDLVLVDVHGDDDEPDDMAWQSLEYIEGFPTLAFTALPFWERIPGEPLTSYELFRAYLDYPGERSFHEVALRLNADKGRSIEFMPDMITSRQLQTQFDLYYWLYRCRAYDLFRDASMARTRAIAGNAMEQEHLSIGSKLFSKCADYFDNDDHFAALGAKGVKDLMKDAVQMQRISVGLSPNGGARSEGASQSVHAGVSHSNDIRRLIKDMGTRSAERDEFHGKDSSEAILDMALGDPETADMVQRLQMQITGTPIQGTGDPEKQIELASIKPSGSATEEVSPAEELAEAVLSGEI